MKNKRIEELLEGTDYGDKTKLVYEDVNVDSRSYSIQTVRRGEQRLYKDAALNAARVQLLAKALQDARAYIESAKWYYSDRGLLKEIDAALKEAGFNSEESE